MFLHPRSVPEGDPAEAGAAPHAVGGGDGDSGGSSSEGSSLDRDEFHFGMTTEEEIDQAIAECKEAILGTEQSSDERRWLVRRLVELRLRRLELREEATEPPLPDGVRVVRGHTLQPQRVSQHRVYCHGCSRLIVVVLHRWYHCLGCGINLHSGCLSELHRNCAAELVKEDSTIELRIRPEKTLGSQTFRCADCARTIMIVPEPNPPGLPPGTVVLPARICDYNGRWYCSFCHWNDMAVTPGRIIHNWHFDKYPVSCGSREFLQAICNKPVINLEECNPRLFSFLEELRHIKKLREEVLLMKQYFMSCRSAQRSRILRAFGDRQYFVETSYLYSLRDLCDVPTGELLQFLISVHDKFAKHIREECEACRGKGHICEVCHSDEVLFAFDAQVMPCPRCRRVMHQHCYVRRDGQCPRCARMEARQQAVPEARPAGDVEATAGDGMRSGDVERPAGDAVRPVAEGQGARPRVWPPAEERPVGEARNQGARPRAWPPAEERPMVAEGQGARPRVWPSAEEHMAAPTAGQRLRMLGGREQRDGVPEA